MKNIIKDILSFKNAPLDYSQLIHQEDLSKNTLAVNWCFHSICNFKCSYCAKSLHDGKIQGPDLDIVLKACDLILSQTKMENYFFEFTGGEITYYRKFEELMRELKKRKITTGIISNGSRDISWWERHLQFIDHICLSFHAEEGDPDHFFKVVSLLSKNTVTHVNIMMLPSKFEELHSLAIKIAEKIPNISISMQPLFKNMDGRMFNYTPSQLTILNEHLLPLADRDITYTSPPRGGLYKVKTNGEIIGTNAAALITNQENSWKGWLCWAGVENLIIDKDGQIFRGWCRQGGSIGTIYHDFKIPNTPLICKTSSCYCAFDVMSTKKALKS